MPEIVLTEIDAARGVATLTLNRPEARNPTSIALLDAMDEALDAIAAEPAVRALVLAGVGKAFCAGLDLSEVQAGAETVHRLLTRLGVVMRRIRRLECVTIARVQGAAIGGGFGFMAVADFAVTHAVARIGYPPVKTGLSPALMAPWLIRKIGASPARAMLLAGGTITGAEAHARGIATHCVALDEIDATVQSIIDELLATPPHATIAMKRLLNDLDGSINDEALDLAARTSAEVIAHDETQKRLRELFGVR
jgi:enoyl-CoA hydratase/carnithine racemase